MTESVPVPVLEALASAWEDQAERLGDDESAGRFKTRAGARVADVNLERGSCLIDCARMLREAIAPWRQPQ
jgi:hypothetical protein